MPPTLLEVQVDGDQYVIEARPGWTLGDVAIDCGALPDVTAEVSSGKDDWGVADRSLPVDALVSQFHMRHVRFLRKGTRSSAPNTTKLPPPPPQPRSLPAIVVMLCIIFLYVFLGHIGAPVDVPTWAEWIEETGSLTSSPGNDLMFQSAISVEEAQERCVQHPECSAFTYHIREGSKVDVFFKRKLEGRNSDGEWRTVAKGKGVSPPPNLRVITFPPREGVNGLGYTRIGRERGIFLWCKTDGKACCIEDHEGRWRITCSNAILAQSGLHGGRLPHEMRGWTVVARGIESLHVSPAEPVSYHVLEVTTQLAGVTGVFSRTRRGSWCSPSHCLSSRDGRLALSRIGAHPLTQRGVVLAWSASPVGGLQPQDVTNWVSAENGESVMVDVRPHASRVLYRTFQPPEMERGTADGVVRLVGRVFGAEVARAVHVSLLTSSTTDWYEYSSNGGQLTVKATSGVAAARGVYSYVKRYCRAMVTWGRGEVLTGRCPTPLPPAPATRATSLGRLRYYYNVCTFGYSTVWWDEARWLREVDWMALHGINLPLFLVGQEKALVELYREYGVSEEEALRHMGGPAFLPWHTMGNIKVWGGPLKQSWVERRSALQRVVLRRMEELGVNPVLPGFAGFVPSGMVNGTMKAGLWMGFREDHSGLDQVVPTHPKFKEIGRRFIQIQRKLSNTTTHFYAADTFNENRPQSGDLQFIGDSARAVVDAVREADRDGKWVVQGWLFANMPRFWTPQRAEAYLSAGGEHVLLLDLASEKYPQGQRLRNFGGTGFLWCLLHNYGGRRGIYGPLRTIATDPATERFRHSNMLGTGITAEAIEHNPLVYELMTDVGWSANPIDLQEWLAEYLTARYGQHIPQLVGGWLNMSEDKGPMAQNVGCCPPLGTSFLHPTVEPPRDLVEYDYCLLSSATATYLDVRGPVSAAFRYDIIDLYRQYLEQLFVELHGMLPNAVQRGAVDNLRLSTALEYMETILATHEDFLLGPLLKDAEGWAKDDSELEHYRHNAINLLTLWGPPPGNANDYAARTLSGMYAEYHLKRWQVFLTALREGGSDRKADDAATSFEKSFEENVVQGKISFPLEIKGDTLTAIHDIHAKIGPGAYREGTQLEKVASHRVKCAELNHLAGVCSLHAACVGFSVEQQAVFLCSGDGVPVTGKLWLHPERQACR